jgi:hypothetical protein
LGLLVMESAPRAQTMAAFWWPTGSTASASSASPPNPIGMRKCGTGSGTAAAAVATEVAIEVTFETPAAVSSVGTIRVMNACTVKSAGWAAETI